MHVFVYLWIKVNMWWELLPLSKLHILSKKFSDFHREAGCADFERLSFLSFLKHYTRMHLEEDKRSVSGGVGDRYYCKRKARRRSGSLSLCAAEDDVISDTVTHCVCVKDRSSGRPRRSSASPTFISWSSCKLHYCCPAGFWSWHLRFSHFVGTEWNIQQDMKLSLLPCAIFFVYSLYNKENAGVFCKTKTVKLCHQMFLLASTFSGNIT